MKKAFRFTLMLAAAAMVFSCGQFEPEIPIVDPVNPGNPDQPVVERNVTFSATTETLSEWAAGDKISIFDGKAVLSATNSESGVIAKFPVTLSEGFTSFTAFFPENSNLDELSADASIPASQKAVAGSYDKAAMPMIAKSETSKLFFRETGMKLAFTLDMDGAQTVVISANGAKIAGDCHINFMGENPAVTAGSNTADEIEIAGPFTRGETYMAVALPATINGYSMVVKDAKGEEIAHHVSETVISGAVGQIAVLDEVKADDDLPTVFKISHMWLWGGTGPEYGCTKLYDMFTKPDVFDSTDGRGIEAVKDDYIELWSDGTMYNWAGEDARHWWMAYDKEKTPSKYKSLDMTNKYYVIPRNEGKWSFDPTTYTYTFTNEEGVQTTATVVAPGTYELPGCSPAKSITITTMALKFNLQNGSDYWDNPASDYDVFYKRPRQLFIEVEQMPAGFVTPESVKTKDTEVFVEPDDPAPAFDITQLPGTYKVNNLRVNGGSGSDATFVNPVEKSWCWDDSIWWESDNKLKITATGISGNIVSGTLNYWGGNDEKFWDYLWHGGKDDQVDMSAVYGILPHGVSNFTFDAEKRVATINGNVTCTIYGAFEKILDCLSREFVVNDGCIALVFHIMEPIPATSQQWTDVDRFVNAPIDYVMEFVKEGE